VAVAQAAAVAVVVAAVAVVVAAVAVAVAAVAGEQEQGACQASGVVGWKG